MSRRSYNQFCGLARALDVVGERWTLLIIRELLIQPARYSELAAALPGIASNLLADRLRGLVAAGVVERRLDTDSSGVVYALTSWGMQLRETVDALVRWSTPLMIPGRGTAIFQPQWLVVALHALLRDKSATPPLTIGLDVVDVRITVCLDELGPHVMLEAVTAPGTVLRATPEVILGLAAGVLSVDQAVARGSLRGDPHELARVFGSAPVRGNS